MDNKKLILAGVALAFTTTGCLPETDLPTTTTLSAVNDSFNVEEDTTETLGVLDNDDKADTVTAVSIIAVPANGQVVVTAGNAIEYTPHINFNGVDSFTYQIADASGNTSTAEVNLTVAPDTPIQWITTFPISGADFSGSTEFSVSGYLVDTDDGVIDEGDVDSVSASTQTWNLVDADGAYDFSGFLFSELINNQLTINAESNSEDTTSDTLTVTSSQFYEDLGPGRFDIANNEAYLVDHDRDAIWHLNLATGERTIISDESTGSGQVMNYPYMVDIDITTGELWAIDIEGVLYAVDKTTGDRTVISSDIVGTGDSLYGARTAIQTADGSSWWVVTQESIIQVDADTGNRTALFADDGYRFFDGKLDTDNNRMLVVDTSNDALFAISLSDGSITEISGPSVGSGSTFQFPVSITTDYANNRVFIADSQRDRIYSVDLTTGDRVNVFDSSIGTGVIVSGPSFIWYDTTTEIMYVVDNGRNDSIYSFPIATGDRTLIDKNQVGTGDVVLSGVDAAVLDDNNGMVYAMAQFADAIIKIDPINQTKEIISDNDLGSGDDIDYLTDMKQLDDDTLIAVDRNSNAVILIDIATGNRSPLSDATTGTGTALSNPQNMALDIPNNRLFVSDFGAAGIYSIDLTTGDRTIVTDASTGTGDTLNGPAELAINGNTLYVMDGSGVETRVYGIDITTGDRTVVSSYDNRLGEGAVGTGPLGSVRDLHWNAERNRLIAVIANSDNHIIEIDVTTGDRTAIVTSSNGKGVEISNIDGLVFDDANKRWMIFESSKNALVLINMAEGAARDRAIIVL